MDKPVHQKIKPHKHEEREVKVSLSRLQYQRLLKMRPKGSRSVKKIFQTDVYYDRDDFYLTNLNRGLRVRFNEGYPVILEYKSLFCNPGNPDNPWFIEEIPFTLPLDTKKLKELFLLLIRLKVLTPIQSSYHSCYLSYFPEIEKILYHAQLKPLIRVCKHRTGYCLKGTQYIFDHIKGLGYFLEIESTTEDPMEVLTCLGVNKNKIIRNGYNDMLATGISACVPNEEKQRKFKENPTWNVLPEEQKLVRSLLSYYRLSGK